MLAVLFGEMSAAEAARWHGTSDMSVLKWKQLFLDAGAQVGQRVRGDVGKSSIIAVPCQGMLGGLVVPAGMVERPPIMV